MFKKSAITLITLLVYHTSTFVLAAEQIEFLPADEKSAADNISVLVTPGRKLDSIIYYDRLESELSINLLNDDFLPEASMDNIIEYFGYEGLTSEKLEELESNDLMPRDSVEFANLATLSENPLFENKLTLSDFQNNNVLVSRFFAPKIVDYSNSSAPFAPGWRKVVRLKSLAGSDAELNGMRHVYILFNYIEADVTKNPFAEKSKNNQVIIVPATKQLNKDSAFFLVFGQSPQYRIEFSLKGVAFDLPSVKIDEYFVPSSCAQCHGHDGRSGVESPLPPDLVFEHAIVNYLDTDQWHDAMALDFPQLNSSDHPVIFDGGGDVTSPKHVRAFEVIRALNDEALLQTESVDDGGFKTIAATKWRDNHLTNYGHVPQSERAVGTGSLLWQSNNAEDQELLTILNQNCFRCHGSIKYNVFDKREVFVRTNRIIGRTSLTAGTERHMPQGRVLDDKVIERIKELLLNGP